MRGPQGLNGPFGSWAPIGPGHSEQGIWCTSQTEGTNHAHESWPWAWTIIDLINITFILQRHHNLAKY